MAEPTNWFRGVRARIAEELRFYLIDGIRKGWDIKADSVKKTMATVEENQGKVWIFINTRLQDDTARERIVELHERLRRNRRDAPRMEDRFVHLLVTLYVDCEDDAERQRVFTDLGRSGNTDQPLDFIEVNKFYTAWLVTKKLGRDTWGFLTGKFGSAKDFAGRHPVDFRGLADNALRHRGQAQRWMERYAATHPTPTRVTHRRNRVGLMALIIIAAICVIAIIAGLTVN